MSLSGFSDSQEQQLRDDQVGRLVHHRPDQEDHVLAQQARIDVVGALATAALLDDDRNHAEALRFLALPQVRIDQVLDHAVETHVSLR